jgi:hypothetical protein
MTHEDSVQIEETSPASPRARAAMRHSVGARAPSRFRQGPCVGGGDEQILVSTEAEIFRLARP